MRGSIEVRPARSWSVWSPPRHYPRSSLNARLSGRDQNEHVRDSGSDGARGSLRGKGLLSIQSRARLRTVVWCAAHFCHLMWSGTGGSSYVQDRHRDLFAARTTHREGGRRIRRTRGNSRRQIMTACGGCAADKPRRARTKGPARSDRRPWREASHGLTGNRRGNDSEARPEAREVEDNRREANRDRRNVRRRKRVLGRSPEVLEHPAGSELPPGSPDRPLELTAQLRGPIRANSGELRRATPNPGSFSTPLSRAADGSVVDHGGKHAVVDGGGPVE